MQLITTNPDFLADYQQLKNISLNPKRHTAKNAYEHCEMVVNRVRQLAKQNLLLEKETTTLVNLAYLHDIGKTTGTAKPEKSVELLAGYGEFDQEFVSLVKYHDINLPWFISSTKGQAPTNKAWQKLSRRVNLRLLSLFMVADRIDCPGGWIKNKALVWFLEQSLERGYLNHKLIDEIQNEPAKMTQHIEFSAGGTIFNPSSDEPQILTISVKKNTFELPKGHIEYDETVEETAIREFQEETGISTDLVVTSKIRDLTYKFENNSVEIQKTVCYFLMKPKIAGNIDLTQSPKGTRDIRWLNQLQAEEIECASDDLKLIVMEFFRYS